MSNLKLSIEKDNTCGFFGIKLKLYNMYNHSIKISSDSILLDGFTNNKFKITNKQTGEELSYQGSLEKCIPKMVEILSKTSLESSCLNLNDAYYMKTGDNYSVFFKSFLSTDLLQGKGEIVILTGETSFD